MHVTIASRHAAVDGDSHHRSKDLAGETVIATWSLRKPSGVPARHMPALALLSRDRARPSPSGRNRLGLSEASPTFAVLRVQAFPNSDSVFILRLTTYAKRSCQILIMTYHLGVNYRLLYLPSGYPNM
jgi:hypothetical protein